MKRKRGKGRRDELGTERLIFMQNTSKCQLLDLVVVSPGPLLETICWTRWTLDSFVSRVKLKISVTFPVHGHIC